jgi:hypothetical protein
MTRRSAGLIAATAAFGALHAATWLYFRARQPETDARARERLQPRGEAS